MKTKGRHFWPTDSPVTRLTEDARAQLAKDPPGVPVRPPLSGHWPGNARRGQPRKRR